jgi:hypothetical protein
MSNRVSSAIDGDNALFTFIEGAKTALGIAKWGEITEVTSPFGDHGVVYDMDETGCFATIGFTLPDACYAEIEDGTYGQLNGLRIYRDDVEDNG